MKIVLVLVACLSLVACGELTPAERASFEQQAYPLAAPDEFSVSLKQVQVVGQVRERWTTTLRTQNALLQARGSVFKNVQVHIPNVLGRTVQLASVRITWRKRFRGWIDCDLHKRTARWPEPVYACEMF